MFALAHRLPDAPVAKAEILGTRSAGVQAGTNAEWLRLVE